MINNNDNKDETIEIPLNFDKKDNQENNNVENEGDTKLYDNIKTDINSTSLNDEQIYDNTNDVKEINRSNNSIFRNKKTSSLIVVITLLSICIMFGLYLLFSNNTKIVVDDFKTKTLQDVLLWKDTNEIEDNLIIIKEEYSETYKEGFIISQSLNEGEYLEDTIIFIVSKGYDPKIKVNMIDFTGLPKDKIEEFFNNNHFVDVSYIYEISETITKDKFIKINNEGKSLSRDTIIVITLSLGSAKDKIDIKMPDLSKSDKNNVDIWAKEYFMFVEYTYEFSDTIAHGMVITYSPTKDSDIKTNSTIKVTISKGKKITMSDFVGKNKLELEKWVNENNLILNKYKLSYSSKAKDVILSHDPKSKDAIAEKDDITATISIGQVPIKNHINASYTTFEKWLSDLNQSVNKSAKITVEKKEEESSVPAGSISKMIIGNTTYSSTTSKEISVNPGAKITVYVSKGISITVADKKGTNEEEFKKYITNLGLKHSKSGDIYSTYPAGTIAQNDTGSKPNGSTILYKVSLGRFNPNLAEYNNKTITQINSALSVANNKGAGWKFTKKTDVYSDTVPSGLSLNCEAANKEIKCDISKGKEPIPVNVVSKSGVSKDEFTAYIYSNKLKLGNETEQYHDTIAKGHIISNDTGSKQIGTSINYVISKGPKPVLQIDNSILNALQGSTFDETKNKIHDHLSGKHNDLTLWNIVYEPVKSDITVGQLIPEIPNGTYSIGDTITFKISIGNN